MHSRAVAPRREREHPEQAHMVMWRPPLRTFGFQTCGCGSRGVGASAHVFGRAALAGRLARTWALGAVGRRGGTQHKHWGEARVDVVGAWVRRSKRHGHGYGVAVRRNDLVLQAAKCRIQRGLASLARQTRPASVWNNVQSCSTTFSLSQKLINLHDPTASQPPAPTATHTTGSQPLVCAHRSHRSRTPRLPIRRVRSA